MISALAGFILGVLGWLAARLLFDPCKEIIDLRRKVQEYLIVYGNIGKDSTQEWRKEAANAFRTTGAALVAWHVASYPWLKWIYKDRLKWDIHSGGEFLISLGNSIEFEDAYVSSGFPTAYWIRQSLKLQPVQPSAVAQTLREHTSQAAPLSDGHVDQL